MALLPDRSTEHFDDISWFCNSVSERGGVVSIVTGGSGSAMDNGQAVVIYAGAPSGKVPVGVLMNDVVNIDLTKYELNKYKDEVQVGSKVCIRTVGWTVTNMVKSGDSPTVGAPAYLAADGRLTVTNTGAAASPPCGKFLSTRYTGYPNKI